MQEPEFCPKLEIWHVILPKSCILFHMQNDWLHILVRSSSQYLQTLERLLLKTVFKFQAYFSTEASKEHILLLILL